PALTAYWLDYLRTRLYKCQLRTVRTQAGEARNGRAAHRRSKDRGERDDRRGAAGPLAPEGLALQREGALGARLQGHPARPPGRHARPARRHRPATERWHH